MIATPSSASVVVQDGLPTPRRHVATLAIMATLVLVVLDGAIANVALPTIAETLGVSPAASIWVVNGYQLALVMAILPCAALGESLGLRRVFIGGVALFTAASLLCSLSPSLPWLVAARFLQGLGGAAVVSLGIGLIRFTYPHRMLGAVIGWNATMIALSGAAGPTIGAAILAVSSWPWLFAVNLPVGAIVLLAARALPQPAGTGRKLECRERRAQRGGVRRPRAGRGPHHHPNHVGRRAPDGFGRQLRRPHPAGAAARSAADPARPVAQPPVPHLGHRVGVLLRRADGELHRPAVLPPARPGPGRGRHGPVHDALAVGGGRRRPGLRPPGRPGVERPALRRRRRDPGPGPGLAPRSGRSTAARGS